MPWSLHEFSFSEGIQALFCSNAEQGVSPLIWISPPISFSTHGNAHLSCQQLGLCSPDLFAEQFCTMAQSLHIPRSLKGGRSQQHPPSLSPRSGTSWWASSASLCSAFSVLAFLLTGDSRVKGELGVEQLSLEETPGVFVLSLLEGEGWEMNE